MSTTLTGPRTRLVDELPEPGRAAVRGGVWGNFVDQVNIFLPVTALAPALPTLAGAGAAAQSVAWVVMATLVGRPLGAVVFGRVSDRVGRTATTKVAILGTAACTLAIAAVPSAGVLGAGTIALVIALRFLGGVFLAGEYTSAIPLAMEWSSPRRRGLVSGLIMSMAPWAQATIAFVTVLLLGVLGGDAYAAWGWRMSFVAGGLASLGMLWYYSRRVADARLPHRAPAAAGAAAPARLREVVIGAYRRRFWQAFCLMSGLWFMTNMVVIVLTSRLKADVGLSSGATSAAMGVASVAQAVVMVVAGALSTRVGRRRLFVGWAVLSLVAPLLWWATTHASGVVLAALGAAALQVVTVCAYGPVGAYLNESFPAHVRATAYGTAYSLSIVVPALYPWYLPVLEKALGHDGAPMVLLVLGAGLVAGGALLGPALSPRELDDDLETVASRGLVVAS